MLIGGSEGTPGFGGARVLVTGAAGGIGRAVVNEFARRGAGVVATDVRCAADRIIGAQDFVAMDLRDAGAPARLVECMVERVGGVDVVAHMAGVIRRQGRMTDVTEDDWDLQHDVNLKATFYLFRAAAELMVRDGVRGRLVGMTSQAWWTGGFGASTVYAASKGGLVSLCRGMARFYGAAGITVNTVAGGAIDTPMLRSDLSGSDIETIVRQTPVNRLGTPEDVAAAVAFLASREASFITAATLNVTGGWLAY